MAAAIGECDFDKWLTHKLLKLNPDTDIDVFVQYIRSILDTETDKEEQHESIKDFLEQITEIDLDNHTTEVINVFNEKEGNREKSNNGSLTFDQQLASAVEKAQSIKINTKVLTKEDKERRLAKEAILAQYAQVSDGEVTDDGEDTEDGFGKNVNAKAVVERQQAQREKSKQEHEKKKQKDKEDRDKQKQKAEDRKEAEKKRTQKGERRR